MLGVTTRYTSLLMDQEEGEESSSRLRHRAAVHSPATSERVGKYQELSNVIVENERDRELYQHFEEQVAQLRERHWCCIDESGNLICARVGRVAIWTIGGAMAGGLVGTVTCGPGIGTGIGTGVGAGIGFVIGTSVEAGMYSYKKYNAWRDEVDRVYRNAPRQPGSLSSEEIKRKLIEVFEEDKVLKHFVDPITGNLIQNPARTPYCNTFCEKSVLVRSVRENGKCPFSNTSMSVDEIEADTFVKALIFNRLVDLLENDVKLQCLHAEVLLGLNQLKFDLDKQRDQLFQDFQKALKKSKDKSEISITQYNQQMLEISKVCFGG